MKVFIFLILSHLTCSWAFAQDPVIEQSTTQMDEGYIVDDKPNVDLIRGISEIEEVNKQDDSKKKKIHKAQQKKEVLDTKRDDPPSP